MLPDIPDEDVESLTSEEAYKMLILSADKPTREMLAEFLLAGDRSADIVNAPGMPRNVKRCMIRALEHYRRLLAMALIHRHSAIIRVAYACWKK